MTFLSLDPSTTCIGWAVFENDCLKDYGRLEPTKECRDYMDRVHNLLPQLEQLILKYKPNKIYQEDVPNIIRYSKGVHTFKDGGGDVTVLLALSYAQGVYSTIERIYCNELEYISVITWRKNIGINDGDKRRDSKKIRSIQKVNELFNLDLPISYTRSGNYKSNGSDDIADAILIGCSQIDKYRVKTKSFGKGVK